MNMDMDDLDLHDTIDRTSQAHPGAMSSYQREKLHSIVTNYKLTPATLAHRLNPHWIQAPHLLYIAIVIAQSIAEGNGRWVISVPPRHGKSELLTKYTTLWTLEHFPWKHIILATYGAELSTDFGREVRDIAAQNKELLSFILRKDAGKASNWRTSEGGGMMSAGVGGPITGRGADVLLIDDFIKEIKEALSQTHREYLWNWLVTTALTRLEPNGTAIIVATRWHYDDLIGRILRQNPGGMWKEIHFPAIALGPEDFPRGEFVPDILGRNPGDPLFPERYPIEALQERKDTLGSYFFNALFQQRPENDTGRLANKNWLHIVDHVPNITRCRRCRVWDIAATDGAGDYAVGLEAAYDAEEDFLYILDVIRVQMSSGKLEELVLDTVIEDGGILTGIEKEPGASGKALAEHYQNVVLKDYPTLIVPARDGKIARAQPFLAMCEAGRVALLRAKWNEAYLEEFDIFPSSNRLEHDDQVDASSAAHLILRGKKGKRKSATFGRDREKTEQNGVDPRLETAEKRVNRRLAGEEPLQTHRKPYDEVRDALRGAVPSEKMTSGVTFGRQRQRQRQRKGQRLLVVSR